MTNSARLSGRPSSSAAYNVGDVVDTPDSAIKSWRYLGAGEWEPNDAVRYTMGPGGGIASLAAGAYPLWLQGASLLDRVPLPRMREVLTPRGVDLTKATIPSGATISVEPASDEMYGECIRITLPAGLTLTTGRVMLPIRERLGGGFPTVPQRFEVRMKVDDYEKLQSLSVYVAESQSSMRGHYWPIRGASTSRYGIVGPHIGSWSGQYRTHQCSIYLGRLQTGVAPIEWSESVPEYEAQAIWLQAVTNQETVIEINRVVAPIWGVAGVIAQGDGAWGTFHDHVVRPYMQRGWPGHLSKGAASTQVGMMSAQDFQEAARYGWTFGLHLSHWLPDANAESPTVSPFGSNSTTAADLATTIARGRQAMENRGYWNSGLMDVATCLQNSPSSSILDQAGILKACGIKSCRGRMTDAQFGVHFLASMEVLGTATAGEPIVPGWSPTWGRYNRYFIDGALSVENTPLARDSYVGSHLEKAINRAVNGNELTWWYTHRIQSLTDTTPEADQNGPRFAADYIAHMDDLVRADKVIPLNPMQADLLTYDRPGDVYMDWSGAWRSRTTGKVVL